MKNYELTYLISPDLSEEELKNCREKIRASIQKEGGTLIEFNSPIKKTGESFLTTLNFYLPAEKLISFEKKLKSESEILRYLILRKRLEKKVARRIPAKIIKPKPKAKVELKEIEKKLEEILGE